MEVIDAAEYERTLSDPVPEDDAYTDFRDEQNVPIHTGLFIDDLHPLETDDWEMTGQRAFSNPG